MAIEIRAFAGDPDELAAFITRNWRIQYAEDGYAPTLKGEFVRWMFAAFAHGDPGSIIAAYDGSKLVGVMPSEPISIRLNGSPATMGWTEYFTVDAERVRGGIGKQLREGLKARSDAIGARFSSGYVNSRLMAGKGRKFWTSMGDRMVFPKGSRPWIRLLDGAAAAAAMRDGVSRAAARLAGMAGGPGSRGYKAGTVRLYRPADLAACHQVFVRYMREFDLAYDWDAGRLGHHLGFPDLVSTLVVHDGAGTITGFATCYVFEVMGRQMMRNAIVDMFVPSDRPVGEKVRLLASAVAEARRQDAHLVMTVGPPVNSAAALAAARFVPMLPSYDLALHRFQPQPELDGLRRAFAIYR